MRAWTVDADDIQVADDLSTRELHLTPGIEAFLSPQRSDKFIVVATKGFGKTLLLKAKRVALQERAVCLPQGSLLDKPVGDKIFSADMVALYGTSSRGRTSGSWRSRWRPSSPSTWSPICRSAAGCTRSSPTTACAASSTTS